jgi:lysophospholipase L1-like esterase
VRLHRTRSFVTALCAAALALPAHSALAADPGPYVSLGDSYTAAPLVLNLTGTPLGCLRSDHNYPSLVASALGIASFRDVSCSAATTDDMTSAQTTPVQLLGSNPPQFDALRADTQLVTLGIGGNDVGVVGAAVACASLGLIAPTATACRSHFARPDGDANDVLIALTAPKIAAVLQGIHVRSPQARVLVVGYPDVLPRSGNGCWPVVPLSPDDVRYMDGLIIRTNTMLAEQAALNGAEFVDTYGDSVGHDVCTLPGTRWYEGLVPTAVAFPLHPNALGMQSSARSVLRVLSQPRPVPVPVLTALARAGRSVARGRALSIRYHLDRAATLKLTLQRAINGQRSGASCQLASRANRVAAPCRRYVTATSRTATARAGDGTFAITAADYRRRAGLYLLTATPASGDRTGDAKVVRFRVKR